MSTHSMNSAIAFLLLTAISLPAQVTSDRLLKAGAEPQNWLTYSGGYAGQRHSALAQITPQNVRDLELKWVFQARSFEKFEATPLVVDGVLYTVQAPNDAVALDAATGRVFWTFPYTPSKAARPCCGRVNRGLAISGDLSVHGHHRRAPHRARRQKRQVGLGYEGRER
jgi:alcohol dehydrogenase (cytochrome c)